MLPFGVLYVRRQKTLFNRGFLLYEGFFDTITIGSGVALTKSYKWSQALLVHIYGPHSDFAWGIYIWI